MDYINKAVSNFLGENLVAKLPAPELLNPRTLGATDVSIPSSDCTIETRVVKFKPELFAKVLMSNQYVCEKHEVPNRSITQARIDNELKSMERLMRRDGGFQPHLAVMAATPSGDWVDGGGRALTAYKVGQTYTIKVDVIRDTQEAIAKWQARARATTSQVTLAQGVGINYGLTPSESALVTALLNGTIWHNEGILGTNFRSSTKDDIWDMTKLPRDIREMAHKYAGITVPKNINKSALATIELLARRAELPTAKIDSFITGVLLGENLGARDVRKEAREFLMQRQKGRTVRYQAQIAYMKWAFDKHLSGTPVSCFRKVKVVKFSDSDTEN